MKRRRNDFDVIINGASYVGLTTACILAKNHIKVALINNRKVKIELQNDNKSTIPSRLFALAKASEEYLIENELCNNLKSLSQPINGIFITDYNEESTLEFDPKDIELSSFGCMIDQNDLLSELINTCMQQEDIQLFEENEISYITNEPYNVTARLKDGKELKAKLLIAADGRNSFVRDLLNIQTESEDYNQHAIIFDIKHESDHFGIAIENFYPGGPFAILPKKGKHFSSIVWSTSTDMIDLLNQASKEEISMIISDKINPHLGKANVVSSFKSYPLSLTIAKETIKKRAVLIGDSAHSIHPIAGQGFNLGLRDIISLTNLIINQKKLGLDIGSDLMLKTFCKERKWDIKLMANATHGINDIFASTFIPKKILRKLGMRMINKSSILKNCIMKYASGY